MELPDAGEPQRLSGERSALHVSYVAQVERGERNPGLTNILKIAEALDLDLGDLVATVVAERRTA